MKHLTLLIAIIILLMSAGCNLAFDHSIFNDGFDFPSANVKRITKGKTTTDDLVKLFGGPLSRIDISDNEVEWVYSYSWGSKYTEKGFFVDTDQESSHLKALSIRIKHGIVSSFIYTERK